MITGVETAGLVLAVIPLLISACEHYRDTKSAISRFARKQAYIQRLILALSEQKVVLENEIEYCLRLAGLEDVASTATVDTYSTLLTDQTVVDNLKEELGRSYDIYIKALDRNREAVIDIAKSIKGLTQDADITIENLAKFAQGAQSSGGKFEFRNRFKVALNIGDIDGRIKELDSSMNSLTRIRASNRSLMEAVTSDQRSNRKLCDSLRSVRVAAQTLHQALQTAFPSACHEHVVRLYLDSRSASNKSRKPIAFNVSFGGFGAGHDADSSSKKIFSIQRLWIINTAADQQSSTTRVAFSATVQHLGQPTSFDTPAIPPDLIPNLCSKLAEPVPSNQELGIYFDETSVLRGSFVCSGTNPSPLERASLSMSLNRVIQHFAASEANERATFWTLPQRLQLAANLASSTFQFCTTPWTQHVRSANEIYFHTLDQPASAGGSAPLRIQADCPFVMEKLPHLSRGARSSQVTDLSESLLELGVLLLEIWNGSRFIDWMNDNHLSSPNSFLDRGLAAKQWLDSTKQNILPFYLKAAATCIEGSTSLLYSGRKWDDTAFLNSICGSVVQPLVQACA